MSMSIKADPSGTFGEILVNGATVAKLPVTGSAVIPGLVGTVSQSGGVPTGAIIERGSNANGEYIRYADGTQICWRNVPVASYNVTTAVGTIFRSSALTFSYPATFSETPTGCATVTGSDGRAWIGTCSTGAFWSLLLFSAASSASLSETVRLIAIGRWF